ncbi:MAG TPA: hypothetical protein VHF92_17445 [Geodermatophilus sp.]|nr:hypothetical protein [Geodermatophilus sp.]
MTSRHHEQVDACRRHAGLSVHELWFAYVALGGNVGPLELEAYLAGLMPLDDYELAVLTHAINERLQELGLSPSLPYPHAWFWEAPPGSSPSTGPP